MNSIQTNEITFQGAKVAKKPKAKACPEKDPFLDTPLRNIGFLDEIGAAFRPVLSGAKNPLIKNLPNIAIIPATLYVAADVAHKYNKGEDGTGKKKSVKMAAREGALQGITSILAPLGVVSGVNKAIKKTAPKITNIFEKTNTLNKINPKLLSKAGKLGSALISLFVLLKTSKYIDYVAGKVFEKAVDPIIGIKKDK